MKKKKRLTKKEVIKFISMVLPLLLLLTVVSKSIPDGAFRLDIGDSRLGEKAIALTFDDGPSGYTEELLEGLSEYDAKVTFFVLGANAEKYPDIVKKAYDEGHQIGNHSYDHINFYTNSLRKIEENINKCDDVIEEITGGKSLFIRARHGYTTFWQLKALNTFFVNWSVDSYDWKDKSADYIYERIMENAADGEIILLHDTKEATVEAVLRAVPELLEEGYELVRVDDLLSRNGDKIKMGVPYRSCKYDRGAVAY